jgi:hypothetical protein
MLGRLYYEDKKKYPNREYKFRDAETGYLCTITRKEHYCAYVTIDNNHPYANKFYYHISDNFTIHGGLTYSEDNKFGIDFAHLNDYSPHSGFNTHMSKVWTFQDVKLEILSLAKQFYDQRFNEI